MDLFSFRECQDQQEWQFLSICELYLVIHHHYHDSYNNKFTITIMIRTTTNSPSLSWFVQQQQIHHRYHASYNNKFTITIMIRTTTNSPSLSWFVQQQIHHRYHDSYNNKFTIAIMIRTTTNSPSLSWFVQQQIHHRYHDSYNKFTITIMIRTTTNSLPWPLTPFASTSWICNEVAGRCSFKMLQHSRHHLLVMSSTYNKIVFWWCRWWS